MILDLISIQQVQDKQKEINVWKKITACKQKLSELKKYENIIKKKTCKKLIIFLKSKKKVKP